jgi:acyl transferase domain-containing protein
VPLSARDPERLRETAARLADHLGRADGTRLADVACTLQFGRTPLPERAAVLACDLPELIAGLNAVAAGTGELPGHELAEQWVRGEPVDWTSLWPDGPGRRISLPTYPFAREVRGARGQAEPAPGRGGDLVAATLARLTELVTETVGVADIEPREPLDTYGVDSIAKTRLNHLLGEAFPDASRTLFFDFTDLSGIVAHLVDAFPERCRTLTGVTGPAPVRATTAPVVEHPRSADDSADDSANDSANDTAVAIIGMSGRFPGAADLASYWDNLVAGRTAITEVPARRWDWRELYDPRPAGQDRFRKSHSRWGAFLDGFDEFDPLLFGLSPRQAANIDPQERIFLQECWTALEDAGYAPPKLPAAIRARTGVFAGATKHGFARLDDGGGLELPTTSFGTMVNRVSYHLDLGGPSQPVDTACSSALVAVHEACESIRSGRCALAVAGGVNLYLHPRTYVELAAAGMLSDSGDGAVFGDGANGIVPGEGVGVAVLKAYRDAVRDGDHVYAVIVGSAVNHNGRTSGFTTPNAHRQAAAIRTALDRAGVDPRTIGYLETSANGSAVGDAVELTGLREVFGDRDAAAGPYRLGSVKPNVGHGEAASGMAQLCKVVLAMRHRTLPPTQLPARLNPAIDFSRLPFRPDSETAAWEPVVVDGQPAPLRAGITGVGAGGVNAHLVVQEPPPRPEAPDRPGPALFVLSARTPQRLADYADRWVAFLDSAPEADLAAIAYTVQTGRTDLRHRLAVVARDLSHLADALRHWRTGTDSDVVTGTAAPSPEPAVATRDLAELARLWTAGAEVPWAELYRDGTPPGRVAGLPTYPFERRVCWKENPSV